MIDAGIDWLGRIMREEVAKLFIAPALQEAGFLLAGAGYLWQGQFGSGRVRGNELKKVSVKLVEQAFYFRQQALGWFDHSIQPEDIPFPWNNTFPQGSPVGHLLVRANPGRRFEYDKSVGKNPEATRRLSKAALLLVSEAIAITSDQIEALEASGQSTGEGVYKRQDFIKKLEDEFEVLVESPCLDEPEQSVDETSLKALITCAVFDTCLDLISAQNDIIASYGLAQRLRAEEWLRRSGTKLDWWRMPDELDKVITKQHNYFAEGGGLVVDADVADAIRRTRNQADPYSALWEDRHYTSEREVQRAEVVSQALLQLLVGYFQHRYGIEVPTALQPILSLSLTA
jgi:hypothetical protein